MTREPTIPAIAPDGTLHPVSKLEAHRLGLHHVAVSVFVFCGDKLLIQRRAAGKYHSAGQWANSCCTHPHWGEDVTSCAHRRLGEEVGLSLPLAARGVVDYRAYVGGGMVEHERVHVFQGEAAAPDIPAGFDRGEVSALRWIALDELRDEADAAPERFTPWLRIYLERWNELALRPAA
jgi:isopentenyl-diphosphate delta-isomerase